jgi:hypothetical protein
MSPVEAPQEVNARIVSLASAHLNTTIDLTAPTIAAGQA